MRLEKSKDPNCTIIWSSYKDNKFNDAQYKEILDNYVNEDEYYYNVYTLGLWTPLNVTGRIYKKFTDDWYPKGNITDLEYQAQLPLIICCDFNVNPMKWAMIQKVNGVDYVVDELVQADTHTEKMAKALLERYGRREYIIYGDSTGSARSVTSSRTNYEIIKDVLGFVDLRIKGCNPPVQDRYNAVNMRLCNIEGKRRLLINSKCNNAIRDFRLVVYKEGTGKEEQKPGSDLTHISSAIGYYCEYEYSLRGKPTITWGSSV